MNEATLDCNAVKEYYGKVLKATADLMTSACCCFDDMPEYVKQSLKQVHDEIITRFYGCGSPRCEHLGSAVYA